MGWDLIGHGWAVDFLREQMAAGALHHAYLITGADSIGKRTLAYQLAQALVCERGGVSPCRQCRSCLRMARSEHPDLHLVESDGEGEAMKVEQVRDMQRQIALAPFEASRRVVILLRLHEMTPQAANALLKTLEEPPERVVMIMTARSSESVLPTLVSRCELLPLRPVPTEDLVAGLSKRTDPPRAQLLGALSAGRPGVALSMVEDELALEARNLEIERLFQLLAASRVNRFAWASEMSPGKDLRRERRETLKALEVWLSVWRDVLLVASKAQVPLGNPDQADRIEGLARTTGLDRAGQIVRAVRRTMAAITRNANLQLSLEWLLLNLPAEGAR